MPDYHERIAAKLAEGSTHGYATILRTLRALFPTEQELRDHVAKLREVAGIKGLEDC